MRAKLLNMKKDVSVVVCTRNRGRNIVPTINSILANTHPNFEILIIDQSIDDETYSVIQPFLADNHFRYIRSNTKGLSKARNIGLSEASSDIVAFTDDDCTVPENWVKQIETIFQTHRSVAVVNCRVDPAPTQYEDGVTPCYQIYKNRQIDSIWGCFHSIGMGAGIAVRRNVILSIGGFDTALGAGAVFPSGEDHDIVIRAIIHGWQAYELADTTVIHFGLRNAEEIKALSIRDWYGMGATYIKPLKCRNWQASMMLISKPVLRGLLAPYAKILRMEKPHGFKRILYYLHGITSGIKTPIDKDKNLYRSGNNCL